jgi:E3 ubiquitin-protein ligase RNF14
MVAGIARVNPGEGIGQEGLPPVVNRVLRRQILNDNDGAVPVVVVNAAPPPAAERARRARGRGNPFRPPAANEQGAAIRAHERGGRGRGRANLVNGPVHRHGPAVEQEHAREEAELQRFVELALRDEEEGWDSDELGDEEGFVIR